MLEFFFFSKDEERYFRADQIYRLLRENETAIGRNGKDVDQSHEGKERAIVKSLLSSRLLAHDTLMSEQPRCLTFP